MGTRPRDYVVTKCYNKNCSSPMRYAVTINRSTSYLCYAHTLDMTIITIMNAGGITVIPTEKEL